MCSLTCCGCWVTAEQWREPFPPSALSPTSLPSHSGFTRPLIDGVLNGSQQIPAHGFRHDDASVRSVKDEIHHCLLLSPFKERTSLKSESPEVGEETAAVPGGCCSVISSQESMQESSPQRNDPVEPPVAQAACNLPAAEVSASRPLG